MTMNGFQEMINKRWEMETRKSNGLESEGIAKGTKSLKRHVSRTRL